MTATHITIVMDLIDNIVTEDRKRKYSNSLIVKILVLLQMYRISYRSSRDFLLNHPDIMNEAGITSIPDFRTLSRRARRIDWHLINAIFIDLILTEHENSAIDSFIVKTCKQSTASRRRIYCSYKDEESSWGFSTKGWEYGKKVHVSLDIDSTAVVEWEITTASVSDKNIAFSLIYSVRNYEFIMMDKAYDSSDIYEYIFNNTHSSPLIDTNRRRGIVEERLSSARKNGIEIRKMESSRYSLRWEIERTFAILEDILNCEYIWFARNRNYDVSISMKIVVYNIIIILNQTYSRPKRQIMDFVVVRSPP
ncbi:MAG: transposase [Thermoplasmatales archaeon]|nr:transposase [Candidatus Thermoplasmatota archaeon]MCL6003322.1 transposase [Candidatus Thermoplasmatota archaeon]MDA8054135.1 transposase [Thermoplasmatales archaeon]